MITPLPHQVDAIKAVTKAFETQDRAYMVMACGTGKTATSMWIAEKMQPKTMVVFMPSLALINQFMKEWNKETSFTNYSMLAVCSDNNVTKGAESSSLLCEPITFKVVQTSTAILDYLINDKAQTKIIFCTYQSSLLVCNATKNKIIIDLAIFDEAHKTAGYNKTQFSYALFEENIRIKKRLFMTATPRHGSQKRDKNGDFVPVYSMDDESIYGKRAYELGFREAINLDLICNYKIIVSIADYKSDYVFNKDFEIHEKAVALQKALKTTGAQKVITFHSSINHAKEFAHCLRMNNIHENILHINAGCGMSDRIDTMQVFKAKEKSIITNSRCLTEGVDVPSVDMVAFLNPKGSKIDIVQAIGRALRKAPGKKLGYILLPMLVHDKENAAEEIKNSEFKVIWEVLAALNEQDSDLADMVKNVCRHSGQDKNPYVRTDFRESDFIEFSSEELRKLIHVKVLNTMVSTWDKMLPDIRDFHAKHGLQNFKDYKDKYPELCAYITKLKGQRNVLLSNRAQILEEMGLWAGMPTSYDKKIQELINYKQYGNIHEISAKSMLGRFIEFKRRQYREGTLPDVQFRQLRDIGIIFFEKKELNDDYNFISWLPKLKEYMEQYNTSNVPQRGEHAKLGKWCCRQREQWRKGELLAYRKEQLIEMGFVFDLFEEVWQKRYLEYRNYLENDDVKMGEELTSWVTYQRKSYDKGELSDERIQLLNHLNFDFSRKVNHNVPLLESHNFKSFYKYMKENKTAARIKIKAPHLYKWAQRIRARYNSINPDKNGKQLTAIEIAALKKIGFNFESGASYATNTKTA